MTIQMKAIEQYFHVVLLWTLLDQNSSSFSSRKIFAFDSDSKRLTVMQRLMRMASVECVTTRNCSFLEVSIINYGSHRRLSVSALLGIQIHRSDFKSGCFHCVLTSWASCFTLALPKTGDAPKTGVAP